MPTTRRVSVRIALEGYEEYRATISKLNQQNSILASELGVIDSAYRNNVGSIEHLAERQKILQDSYNTQVEKLRTIGDALNFAKSKQAEYQQSVADAQKKVDEHVTAIDALEKELKTQQEILDNVTNSGRANAKQIQNQKNYIEELNGKIQAHKEGLVEDTKELDKQQAYLNTATGEVNKLTIEYNNQTVAVDNARQALELNRQAMIDSTPFYEKLAEKLKDVSESAGVLADKVQPIAGVLKDGVNSAIKYEDALAGVAKTFNGTDEELSKLNDDIKEMSTRLPATTTEIAKVAENAGQLGINAGDISRFSEVVIGLGNATNITSEEAGTLLAQFENVAKFTDGYGAEGFERFGSVIVELGNNTATTEKDIMNMAQRFSSAGTLAGLSAPDILGMSAALSSVGIASEAGGTSLTKLTQKIQTAVEKNNGDLQKFAQVAGVSADDFAKAWSNNPIEAIDLFIKGLHDTYEEGDSVIELLDEVGFGEVRLRQAVMSLATSEKGLAYYVNMANGAWKDNTALQTEVSKRYETTASKQKMLQNSIELVKIEIGEALLPVINSLLLTARNILVPISEWVEKNPELVQGITVAVGVILGLNTALSGLNTILGTVSLLANPITATIAGIAAALGALAYVVLKFKDDLGEAARSVEDFRTVHEDMQSVIDESNKKFDEQNRITDETATKAQELVSRLSELEQQGLDSEEAQQEYNDTVAELNRLIPDLNLKIDEETGKVEGGTAAVLTNIDAWKKAAKVRAYQEKYQKIIEKQIELEEEAERIAQERTELEQTLAHQRMQMAALESEQKHILWQMEQNDIHGLTDLNIGLRDRLQEINDKEIPKLQREIDKTNQEIDNATQAIEDNAKQQGELQQELDDTEKAMDGVANSANKIYKNVDDLLKEGKKNWGKEGEEVFDVMVNGMQYTIDTRKIDFDTFKERVKKAMDAEGTGEWYMKGLMDGINRQKHKLIATAEGVARSVNNKVRQTWQINSPSKAAQEDAEYLMMGYILGMEKKRDVMVNTMGEIATESTDAYRDAMNEADKAITSSGLLDIKDISGNIKSSVEIRQDRETQTLLSNISNMIREYLPQMSNMQIVMDSNKVVGTLAPKLDTFYANEQLASERGI